MAWQCLFLMVLVGRFSFARCRVGHVSQPLKLGGWAAYARRAVTEAQWEKREIDLQGETLTRDVCPPLAQAGSCRVRPAVGRAEESGGPLATLDWPLGSNRCRHDADAQSSSAARQTPDQYDCTSAPKLDFGQEARRRTTMGALRCGEGWQFLSTKSGGYSSSGFVHAAQARDFVRRVVDACQMTEHHLAIAARVTPITHIWARP